MTTTNHQTTTPNATTLKERLQEALRDSPTDNHWPLCPACETGINEVDVAAGHCTNCGKELT